MTLFSSPGWPWRRRPLLPLLALPLAALPLAALPPFAPGRSPAERTASAPYGGPVLRVLLRQEATLTVGARDGIARLTDGAGRTVAELAPGQQLRLGPDPQGAGLVVVPEAGAAGPGPGGGDAAGPRRLPVAELWLTPRRDGGSQGLVLLGEQAYRGRLQLSRQGEALQAVNHVSLESYLAGVVGSEMPASWPLDALRAQAVAARTYALSQRRPAAAYDLKATVASQVYRGVAAETASTREAVASTRSQVLMHGGALINAVFHSSSGGSTENSGEMWSRQLPYLVSVPDFDQSSPVHSWEKSFDPLQLRSVFRETGGLQTIEVISTSSTGRVRRARVLGPGGSLEISGAELRQRLGLRSTLVTFQLQPTAVSASPAIPDPATGAVSSSLRRLLAATPPPPLPQADWADPASGAPAAEVPAAEAPAAPAAPLRLPTLLVSGRGFGHGVGMSQWGAHALALRGDDYRRILSHYYRGAELRTLPSP
ncbi:MAG: SpoIID/LytB domain-containing protein [Synechococcaceae cyanobacterium]|nr:SpoIID/LytB domain-containing protein [Synechococcaceae cyanobacterium]